jgi:hypothetical protein
MSKWNREEIRLYTNGTMCINRVQRDRVHKKLRAYRITCKWVRMQMTPRKYRLYAKWDRALLGPRA